VDIVQCRPSCTEEWGEGERGRKVVAGKEEKGGWE